MKKKTKNILLKTLCITLAVVILSVATCYVLQKYWAHRDEVFIPDYDRVTLTETTDYETVFLQTGLNKSAVDELKQRGEFQKVLDAQEMFFNPPKSRCGAFWGWFTCGDRLDELAPFPLKLQQGDIVVTLSTHSLGWRHGHTALVIDKDHVLEARVMGENSAPRHIYGWNYFSDYAVLRLKGITEEQQREVVEYALESVNDQPYNITAGFIGKKAPPSDARYFSVQCSYLVWYVYNHFGYDLDSDGGRLVSTTDILHSDLVEVVQVYGMDPRQFVNE